MSGLVTLIWVGQSLALLVASVACFFAPERLLQFLWGTWLPGPADPALRFVLTEARLVAPLLFGISLFSSAASMRDDEQVRRQMARAFALLLGLCAITFILQADGGQAMLAGHPFASHTTAWDLMVGAFSLIFLIQALYGLWPSVEVVEPRMSGTADTKPPRLWALWMFQGAAFCLVGVSLWLMHAGGVALLEYGAGVALAVDKLPVAEFILDVHCALYVGVGLFSFHATSVEREWHWQLYSGIFALIAGTYLLMMIFVWDRELRPAMAVNMLPMLGILLANLYFWWQVKDPIAGEIGHGPDGWTLLDVPTGPFLAIQSLLSGRRSTHLMGVAARGTFKVVSNPDFPPNEFFKAGRKLPLQARFATLSSRDDACNDVRGAAIRLAAHVDVPSPFDMLMNSGSISGPEDMWKFTLGVFTRFLPQPFFYAAVRRDRQVREGLIAGRRRAPECVTMINYYSQIVRFWISTEDVRWLVRYRLLDPTRPESGLCTAEEAAEIWVRERKKGEHRPSNYLRAELKRRLAGKGDAGWRPGVADHPIVMRFQAQFHCPQPGDTLDWYNAGVDWPLDDEHRWRDLATVTLEAPLPDEEAERLRFSAANHPPSLGIPVAPDARDFRSQGDSERRVIQRLAEQRLWRYRVFGYPKFGNTLPDEKGR